MSTPILKTGQPPTATSNAAPSTSSATATATANGSTYRLPDAATFVNASKLAIADDKPIMMDYWADSLDKKALIGVREATGEKLLVKSAEEYTSPIAKLYKSSGEYIVVTENSIYIVAGDIPVKKIA
jgi:hypothetical protein